MQAFNDWDWVEKWGGCPPDCENVDLGACPRCYLATGHGCNHGPLCDGCRAEVGPRRFSSTDKARQAEDLERLYFRDMAEAYGLDCPQAIADDESLEGCYAALFSLSVGESFTVGTNVITRVE